MTGQRMLAIAASSGRLAYVFLVGSRLQYWEISETAARSPQDARRFAKDWIAKTQPEVLVTEGIADRSKKGKKARKLTAAITRLAENELLYDISVARPRRYRNKHEEAEALARQFPELKRFVPPPRRLWESEHRNCLLFEALTLALEAIERTGEE